MISFAEGPPSPEQMYKEGDGSPAGAAGLPEKADFLARIPEARPAGVEDIQQFVALRAWLDGMGDTGTVMLPDGFWSSWINANRDKNTHWQQLAALNYRTNGCVFPAPPDPCANYVACTWLPGFTSVFAYTGTRLPLALIAAAASEMRHKGEPPYQIQMLHYTKGCYTMVAFSRDPALGVPVASLLLVL